MTVTEVAPEPPPPPARVVVLEYKTGARLVSSTGKTYSPGEVPPGTYTFEILLPRRDRFIQLELGTLKSGRTVTIRCSDQFSMCSVE